MKNPGIVFTAPGRAEIAEIPVAEPGDGEVLVRLVRSCISPGTERANLNGVPDRWIGIFSEAPEDRVTWPRRCGYSAAGIVEAVGRGVAGVKAGDRVAVSWSHYARLVCVPQRNVYAIPEGVSFEAAAVTHIATFPMAAVRKCRLEFGESALVMGQGVLGQLAVVILRAAGACPVIAADPVPEKRERALALGADCSFDPFDKGFAANVRAATGRGRRLMAGRLEDAGAQVAIEVTGRGSAFGTALDAVAPFARIAMLGCTRDSDFSVDYYHKVHGRGVTVIGAHTLARPEAESAPGMWTTRDDAEAFLRMLAMDRITLANFVSEVAPAASAPDVFSRLAADSSFPVVEFDWETPPR
ncbi:MAG: zinc-binding dehydrogenase [Kiritimatiellae bacterium]|nr:zinc-binding dehydrogenase [Kiritimatiellia bacterium]